MERLGIALTGIDLINESLEYKLRSTMELTVVLINEVNQIMFCEYEGNFTY